MTTGDNNTLTITGNSVVANKENILPCQNALPHRMNSGKETSQKSCRDIKTKNRNYYQRSNEKNRVLMHDYPTSQTSRNTTNAIQLPNHTNKAGATHISSRLTIYIQQTI